MIQYPEYVTKEDLESILESELSDFMRYAWDNDIEVDMGIRKDRYAGEFVPFVKIFTGDDYIKVDVETKYTESQTHEPGFEFVPTINNAGIKDTMDLYNHDEIDDRFKRWAAIAKLANILYCSDFYPLRYFN